MARQTAAERRAAEVERAERLAMMLTYRKAGLPITEIATKMGVNKSTVSRALKKAIPALYAEEAHEHVAIELARLESVYRKVYPLAMQGNMGAVDRLIKLSESKRRLLGLDRPARLEVGMPEVDLDAAAREIMEAAAAQAMGGSGGA